jgi:dihydrofolate synthase/folylpolyglutamate synthase
VTAELADRLLERFEHAGMKLGLERLRALLEAVGHPERAFPSLLVAGTNGKGSTSALIASICQAAGYRTGLFTSPHLESAVERIRVDAAAIPEAELADGLLGLQTLAEERGLELPSYFEALTLIAFQHFARRQVDIAVLEVGLGGRLDATNVTEPWLSVITAISFDHEQQLGSTLAAIAREKAGVARPGRPLIAWTAPEEVAQAIRAHADGAVLLEAPALLEAELLHTTADRQRFLLRTPTGSYPLDLRLPGVHQAINLGLAVLAAEHLRGLLPNVDANAIVRGVDNCRWPGRLEWVDLPDGRRVLLDAAHNVAGVEALADYLEGLGGKFDLLFGALADKKVAAMLPPLARRAGHVVLTRPPSPRAEDPRAWLGLLDRPAVVHDDPETALDAALDGLAPDRALVICGSIYLLGALRRDLRRRFGVPPPP